MASSGQARIDRPSAGRGIRIVGLLVAAFVAGYVNAAGPTLATAFPDAVFWAAAALVRPFRGGVLTACDFGLVIALSLQINRFLVRSPSQPWLRYSGLGLIAGGLFLALAFAVAAVLPGCLSATSGWGQALAAMLPVDTSCRISLWFGAGLKIGWSLRYWADVVSPFPAGVVGMLVYARITGLLKRAPTAGDVFD